MATYTTNINLKKPAQSDKIRIADFNGNADNIDAAFGEGFGQSSKPSVNASINNLADGLAIVAQGNVHVAISAGQFVYVRGHGTLVEGLYVANQAISANGTLSSSNLDADTSGGLNALNSNFIFKTSYQPNVTTTTGDMTAITSVSLEKGVWVVACNIKFTTANATGARGLVLNFDSTDTTYINNGSVANEWVTLNTTTVINLASAQTVTLKAYQTSGTSLYANGSLNCVRIKA